MQATWRFCYSALDQLPTPVLAVRRFGKGIYFADMVSKSANYCFASPDNPRGLLILSEVALGQMYERVNAEYVEKLPKGKSSTKGESFVVH